MLQERFHENRISNGFDEPKTVPIQNVVIAICFFLLFDGYTTQVDQSDSWIRADPIGILWKSDQITSDYVGSW
jgi:hypothetical protein